MLDTIDVIRKQGKDNPLFRFASKLLKGLIIFGVPTRDIQHLSLSLCHQSHAHTIKN
jgi:hypothetical protein